MNLNPRTEGKEYPIIAIHGPSGSGKTRAAATISQFHQLRSKDERGQLIELNDVLWLLFDRDGLQSLQSQGMEPAYYDFSVMTTDLPNWQMRVEAKLDEALDFVRRGEIKYMVIDTLSTLCEYYDTYHLGKQADARRAYGESLIKFKSLMLKLKAFPTPQIWLVHSKSAWVDAEKATDQQKAGRVATMPGEFDVDYALTAGWKAYVRHIPNLAMGLSVDDNEKRFLITSNVGNDGPRWYFKNRYDDLLKPKEDVNLRTIMQRINDFDSNLKKAQP